MKIKIMFFFAICGMIFGAGSMIIGLALLSFYIGFTGMCGFIFGATKLYSLLNLKKVKTKNDELFIAWALFYCTIIIAFLHFSFAVVDTFFHHDWINFNLLMVLFFATQSFFGITGCTINAIMAFRDKRLITHHLNFIDLANAIIAISLTQRAILYYTNFEHARLVTCIAGIFFSFCAGLLCIVMFRKNIIVSQYRK